MRLVRLCMFRRVRSQWRLAARRRSHSATCSPRRRHSSSRSTTRSSTSPSRPTASAHARSTRSPSRTRTTPRTRARQRRRPRPDSSCHVHAPLPQASPPPPKLRPTFSGSTISRASRLTAKMPSDARLVGVIAINCYKYYCIIYVFKVVITCGFTVTADIIPAVVLSPTAPNTCTLVV